MSGDIHLLTLITRVPGGMFNCMLVDLPFISLARGLSYRQHASTVCEKSKRATDLIPQIAAQVSVGSVRWADLQ